MALRNFVRFATLLKISCYLFIDRTRMSAEHFAVRNSYLIFLEKLQAIFFLFLGLKIEKWYRWQGFRRPDTQKYKLLLHSVRMFSSIFQINNPQFYISAIRRAMVWWEVRNDMKNVDLVNLVSLSIVAFAAVLVDHMLRLFPIFRFQFSE